MWVAGRFAERNGHAAAEVGSTEMTRRLAALAALVLALVTFVLMALVATADLPRGALGLALLAAALAAGWHGLVRRGVVRIVGLGGGAGLIITILVLQAARNPALVLASITALLLGLAAGTYALKAHVAWPRAPRPAHPVLFWNPRSGDGKAERVRLWEQARARGIEPIELVPGADLEQLVRDALDRGADALAIAGGDGSQATVAVSLPSEASPSLASPPGPETTLRSISGVDRNDVVGALDALVDGGERRVDLGEVNGRTFVNNVSLGVYGEAVQRAGYRDAKIQTLLQTVPDVLGPTAKSPSDGAAPMATSTRVRWPSSSRTTATDSDPDGSRYPAAPRQRAFSASWCSTAGQRGAARTWTTPSFEVDGDRRPCPPASTAKRWSSIRRFGFASGAPPCAAACSPPSRRVAVRPSARGR